MATYQYNIELFSNDKHFGWLSGDVEAERYSSACIQAWERIDKQITDYTRLLGQEFSVGELQVTRKESE